MNTALVGFLFYAFLFFSAFQFEDVVIFHPEGEDRPFELGAFVVPSSRHGCETHFCAKRKPKP